jgi:predicted ATP-dependent endonuclease of OLD family
LVLGELVLSDRSSCVFENEADLYSYSLPIWNTLKMFASLGEDFQSSEKAVNDKKSRPSFQGWLSNICKLNRFSYSSELYNSQLYLSALKEYLIKMAESEVYSERIISAILDYFKLFNNKTGESYIEKLYTSDDLGMLQGSSASDREVLLNTLRSMLATFADDELVVNHLKIFEKCEILTKSWGVANSERNFEFKEASISPDSPLVLVSEFLSEFWDTVIEYSLQSAKLSVFDKRSIQQKTFFTAEDAGVFKSLVNFEKFLSEQKAVKEVYMKKLFKSLIGLGTELKIESLLNGEIKTINIKKGKTPDINISHLGTGHFYLVVMYLKLLETLKKQKRINWDEIKVYEVIACDESNILVLVEPESFLHPNAQVQLANLISHFVSNGLRIIIETHSEHFIRALQLAVANGKISKEKLSIYYFENDLGTIIRPIRLDTKGFLLDKFGEGFIDETPRLIQEFFKANKN